MNACFITAPNQGDQPMSYLATFCGYCKITLIIDKYDNFELNKTINVHYNLPWLQIVANTGGWRKKG